LLQFFLVHVARLTFLLHFGQDQIMTGLLLRCFIYVQILSGWLALMIENLKAHFLAYPKACEAGPPDRRRMNKHVSTARGYLDKAIPF